jgi:hypothetical protein
VRLGATVVTAVPLRIEPPRSVGSNAKAPLPTCPATDTGMMGVGHSEMKHIPMSSRVIAQPVLQW